MYSTMDLQSGYHQVPLLVDDWVNTTFWGINQNGKFYHWKFLPFGFKNASVEFQRVMDWILASSSLARCYINDVIIFSGSPQEQMRHLQEVFESLWHGDCACIMASVNSSSTGYHI